MVTLQSLCNGQRNFSNSKPVTGARPEREDRSAGDRTSETARTLPDPHRREGGRGRVVEVKRLHRVGGRLDGRGAAGLVQVIVTHQVRSYNLFYIYSRWVPPLEKG